MHDFIVIYNETFKYIDKKFGADAVKDLWATISLQWCTHLRELVETKGLEGMLEYWGGTDGTLGREKAQYNASLDNGIFKGTMFRCPSVGELHVRGREVYHGGLTYCDHCRFLYAPIARECGFEMSWNIDFDESGKCTGSCSWISFKK